ncbi:hypothetical protein [Candidatus Protochlamydia phocaeensis]|uniref:hypothetical protein n=1 Tax=Candidatus Protochlamydia phocaeensis TaxID=1414722 RepID=UPI0008399775|nr:hypothetical protein [Candidatus Protochlamydia phocaeensis]
MRIGNMALTGSFQLNKPISFHPPFSRQNKCIGLIVFETELAEGRMRLRDKKLALEWKFICQDLQQTLIQKKIAAYNRYFHVIESALGQYVHCRARFTQGFNKAQNLFILSGFLNQNSSSLAQLTNTELYIYDHVYRTRDGLIQEYRENIKQAEEAFERLFNLFKRVNDAQARVFFEAVN